jgi:hypothetical protein
MADLSTPASEEEVNDFLAKLAQFHATLDDKQKAMLDELTVAALTRPQGEVEGFDLGGNVFSMHNTLMTEAGKTQGVYNYYYKAVADLAGGQFPGAR